MDDNLIPFPEKVRQLLKEKGISLNSFELETGIARQFFCKGRVKKHNKSTIMVIAHFLDMDVEDLVDGTTGMDAWYC